VEAAAIRADHAVATAGMRAFVRMGFRLMDVKSRLPHGKYMAWVRENLPELSEQHLSRAKHIAEGFSNSAHARNLEELSPEILAIIDGASESGGYRALLAEVHEFPECIGSEANAKELCEARWLRHPEERDDWEPRVLSGELNYHRALTGMLGSSATAGKSRAETGVFPNLLRASNLMARHFSAYDEMTVEAKNSYIVSLEAAIEKAPPEVKASMLRALQA
jgi:hypothetical protein